MEDKNRNKNDKKSNMVLKSNEGRLIVIAIFGLLIAAMLITIVFSVKKAIESENAKVEYLLGFCIIAALYLMHRLVKLQRNINLCLQREAKTAKEAGKAKSQFLAQMSHEIRTPINAVLGMNEMILRECTDETVKEYSENIQSAGRILLALINSILDFSKIEAGDMEIIPVDYATVSVVHDLVNMIEEKAQKKGIALNLEIDPNLPKVLNGDDVRIRQIIVNLLTNAVKYTHEGSVTLKMNEVRREQGNVWIAVEVEDTGIGIREEDMEKLFMSFRRLDEVRNREIEGTGLGMAIVSKLLELMGSGLEVTSVYGEGSKFRFILVQKIVDAEPIGDYSQDIAEGITDRNSGKYIYAPDTSVLIVDDNQMNLKVAEGLFKRGGMKTDVAESGEKCIDMAKHHQYDIIFLDHMMPDMDGVETLSVLKRENILRDNTAVVALTANAIVGAREKYLSLGFDDYLTKPIEIEELEKLFLKYLPGDKITFKEISEKKRENHIKEEKEQDAFTQKELLNMHIMVPDIDIVAGLVYCAESKTFYLEMLKEYVRDSKTEALEKFMMDEDMENYRIAMHSLKSMSLNIGAFRIAQKVKKMETAAGNKDISYIREHHDETLAMYRKLLSQLRDYFAED